MHREMPSNDISFICVNIKFHIENVNKWHVYCSALTKSEVIISKYFDISEILHSFSSTQQIISVNCVEHWNI